MSRMQVRSSYISQHHLNNISDTLNTLEEQYFQQHVLLYTLLKKTLSTKRLQHSVYVAKRSVELVLQHPHYHNMLESAWIAGLAHDACREHNVEQLRRLAQQSTYEIEDYEWEEEILLHGKAAVTWLQQKYPLEEHTTHIDTAVHTKELVSNSYFAIAHHTLGWKVPSDALLVLYVADASSKDRNLEESFLQYLATLDIPLQCNKLITLHAQKYKILHPITKGMHDYCIGVSNNTV